MFKTQYNADRFDKVYEPRYGKELTLPDQDLGLREILARFSRGMPLPPADQNGFYDDDEDGPDLPPDWDSLDISEKYDFMQEQRRVLDEVKEREKLYLSKKEEQRLEKLKQDLKTEFAEEERKRRQQFIPSNQDEKDEKP